MSNGFSSLLEDNHVTLLQVGAAVTDQYLVTFSNQRQHTITGNRDQMFCSSLAPYFQGCLKDMVGK